MTKAKLLSQAVIGVALVATLSPLVTPAYAASPAIKSNRENECAIYLCLPSGFAEGCDAAKSAYISRITDFNADGSRRYTDLPDFVLCLDETPAGLPEADLEQSTVDWRGAYEVTMPSTNTCTRWATRTLSDSQSVTYCAAIQTTPGYTFESDKAKHPYQTIDVGDTAYRQGLAPVRRFTEVLVDGSVEGQRYYAQ